MEKYKWGLPKLKTKDYVGDNHYEKYTTVSMVAHNEAEMTSRCLKSIWENTPQDYPASEIIIYDNNSTDRIEPYVEAMPEHPAFEIVVVNSGVNIGFGRAHNLNLDKARGKYFIVINNDIEIKDKFWLDKITTSLKGVVLQVGGWSNDTCSYLKPNGDGTNKEGIFEYIEGSIFGMRTEWAKRFGLFDETFEFAYCEDSDLSLRIRGAGFNIYAVPLDFVHHRATTTKGVLMKGDFDLHGYSVINKIRFNNRWHQYLQKRNLSPRIAILREGAMGDVLAVSAVVKKIKQLTPHCTVDLYTNAPQLVQENPNISHIYPLSFAKTTSGGYDCTINLDDAYEKNPKENFIRAYFEEAGIEGMVFPEFYANYKEKAAASEIIGTIRSKDPSKKIAVFHTGRTNWQGRNLPVETFEEAGRWMQDNGFSIIEVGDSATESMELDTYKFLGINPRTSAAIIQKCDLFVGIDSMCWQVAQASLVPSVVVFGCIDPATRIIEPLLNVAVQALGLNCLGCHHEFFPPVRYSGCVRSREAVAPCMAGIQAGDIINGVIHITTKGQTMSETEKIRAKVSEYLSRAMVGIDIGCGQEKLFDTSIGFDKRPSGCTDITGNATQLPYPNETFEYVFSSHCLEDLPDTESVLVEWLRVIKKGGLLALYLPHKDWYKGCNLDHVQEFDEQIIKDILMAKDCEILESYLDTGEFGGVPDNRYSFLIVARKV